MVSITIAALLCLASLASIGVVIRVRRRRLGFSGLDNISVSRQWLIQHQTDERS